MAMAKTELKTQKNDASVDDYLDKIPDDGQRADCKVIHAMMQKASGDPGSMWGSAIVGYGTYHYKYASGREADWMRIGFSPRKGKTTIYLSNGFDQYQDLLAKLGKHSTGKGCLYIKHLSDVDQGILEGMITDSAQHGVPLGSE